jgi:FkbM family methyltransferase
MPNQGQTTLDRVMTSLRGLYWHRHSVIPESYRRVMYRRFRRPGQVIKRDSLLYRLHDHNEAVGEAIYVHGSCAKYVNTLLQAARPFFPTFIDVGANIGSVTIPFVKGFSGTALSIEPAAANYNLLVENLRLNDLDMDRVICRRVAIGEVAGTAELFHSPGNSGDHRLAVAQAENRDAESVDVVTLDSLVLPNAALRPPYLIKVDVQGYEAKVLASAKALLKQPCLFVAEFWPYGLKVSGSSASEFSRLVSESGLRIYEVTEDRVAIRPADLASIAR